MIRIQRQLRIRTSCICQLYILIRSGQFCALGEAISAFLRSQRPDVRTAFLRRYWYADSVEAVSLRLGWSVSKTKSALFRTRKKLKDYLIKEELWHE